MTRAWVWEEQSNWEKALADLNDAIAKSDGNKTKAHVLSYRGDVYLRKHEMEKAFADFEESLKLNPLDSGTFILRAGAHLTSGKPDKAVTDYSTALWLDPDNATILVQRADAFRRNKELRAAKADLEKAIKAEPSNIYAWTALGNLHATGKEFKKAIDDYTEALRLDAQSAEGHNDLAWLLATCPDDKIRDGKSALEHATKADDLSEHKQASIIDTLAAAHAELGDFDKAVEVQRKAIELAGSDEKQRKELANHLELFQQRKPVRDDGNSDS
jgi:tetratricopeptide (TPR) repeat protein